MAEKKTAPPPKEMSQQYIDEMVALRRAQEQTRIFEEKKNRGPLTASYFSTQNPIGRALGLRGDYEPNTVGQIMGGIIGAIAPFSVETDYEKQDDGFYDRTYKNVQLDTPQFIKDMSNRITDQMTAADMGYVEPMKAAETAADFVGSGILLSAPARQAARDAGQTILGTSGGRIEPRFDIGGNRPPTNAVGDILNPLNDTANPSVDFTGPFGRTNPPVKKTNNSLTDITFSPAQSALGRMQWGDDLGKQTLKGSHILNQMKRFGVTKEELEFLGIDRYLGSNPNRKFSFTEVNNIIDNQMPDITLNVRRATEGDDKHITTQRLIHNLYDDNYFEVDIVDLDVGNANGMPRNPSKRGRTTYSMDANHSPVEGAIGHFRGTYVNSQDIGLPPGENVAVIEEMQFDLTQDGQLKRGRNAPIIDGKSTAYATTENIAELQGSFDTILNSPEYQKFSQKRDIYEVKKAELKALDDVADELIVAQDAFKPGIDDTRVISNLYLDKIDKQDKAPTITVQQMRIEDANGYNLDLTPQNIIEAAPTDKGNMVTRELNLGFPGTFRSHVANVKRQLEVIDNAIATLQNSVPEGTPFPDLAQRKMNVLQAKRELAQEQVDIMVNLQTSIGKLDEKFSDVTDAFQVTQSSNPIEARQNRKIARRNAASANFLDDQGQPLTGEALAAAEAKYVDFPKLEDISTSEFSVEALMEMGFPQGVAAKLSPRYIEKLTFLKNNASQGQNRSILANEVLDLEDQVSNPGKAVKFFFNDGKLKRNIQGKGYTEVEVNRSVLNSVIRGESLDDIEKKILVQNPPHKKNTTAAKMGYRLAIRNALDDGANTIVFPNSRDIAQLRSTRDSTAFDDTYDAVPKSIIQEYQKMGYSVEVGVLSPGQLSNIGRYGDSIQGPARYIRFTKPDELDGTSVRLYNKGGYVRTGILSVTRKAS